MFDTSDPRLYLFAALAIVALLFLHQWVSTARASAGDGSGKGGIRGKPNLFELAVGFGTNFFDTLGIGSFAPTTSLFKLAKTVPDDEIPRHHDDRPHPARHHPGLHLHGPSSSWIRSPSSR